MTTTLRMPRTGDIVMFSPNPGGRARYVPGIIHEANGPTITLTVFDVDGSTRVEAGVLHFMMVSSLFRVERCWRWPDEDLEELWASRGFFTAEAAR